MASESKKVDFDAVKRNAREQGVPLSEIAILYCDLSPAEEKELKDRGLAVHISPGGRMIAKFPTDENPMFPDKAVGVHTLGA